MIIPMNNIKRIEPEKLSAFWYAMGAVIVIPFISIVLVAMGVLLLAGYPFFVVLMYIHRKEEIEKGQGDDDQRRN
jgi:hypothetical protein